MTRSTWRSTDSTLEGGLSYISSGLASDTSIWPTSSEEDGDSSKAFSVDNSFHSIVSSNLSSSLNRIMTKVETEYDPIFTGLDSVFSVEPLEFPKTPPPSYPRSPHLTSSESSCKSASTDGNPSLFDLLMEDCKQRVIPSNSPTSTTESGDSPFSELLRDVDATRGLYDGSTHNYSQSTGSDFFSSITTLTPDIPFSSFGSDRSAYQDHNIKPLSASRFSRSSTSSFGCTSRPRCGCNSSASTLTSTRYTDRRSRRESCMTSTIMSIYSYAQSRRLKISEYSRSAASNWSFRTGAKSCSSLDSPLTSPLSTPSTDHDIHSSRQAGKSMEVNSSKWQRHASRFARTFSRRDTSVRGRGISSPIATEQMDRCSGFRFRGG